MWKLTTATLLAFAGVSVVAAPPPAPAGRPTAAQVANRFYRSWLEVKRVEAGVAVTDPNQLNGNDYSVEKSYSWGRRGELATGAGEAGPRIDADTEPMRVDFRGSPKRDKDGKEFRYVLPGIFKFEGNDLVIAYAATWAVERKLGQPGDYAERPTTFASTKANGVTVVYHKPCAFYDQD